MSAAPATLSHPSVTLTKAKRQPKGSTLCTQIQKVLHADCLNPKVDPSVRAQAARAWKELEILRNALRKRPLPLHATMKIEPPEPVGSARKRNIIANDSASIIEQMVRERLSRESQGAPPTPPAAPQE